MTCLGLREFMSFLNSLNLLSDRVDWDSALYLLGVSQVTKFMNFDIKIFFDKLIPYCKSKCCAKIQLSIFIASHRNNYLENIFLYRVL